MFCRKNDVDGDIYMSYSSWTTWFNNHDMNCCWDYFNSCISFRRICFACIMKSASMQSEDLYSVWHYCDVIMGAVASQITSLTIVYSTVYSDADQRKHQSSTSPANSLHKGPVTRKMYPFDDVIMIWMYLLYGTSLGVGKLNYELYATYFLFLNLFGSLRETNNFSLAIPHCRNDIWLYAMYINVLVAMNSFWNWIGNSALKGNQCGKHSDERTSLRYHWYLLMTKKLRSCLVLQVGKMQLRFCCGLVLANLTLMGSISFSEPWFIIKISYQDKKSYCGDDTVANSSHPQNGIFHTGKMATLYWSNSLSVMIDAMSVKQLVTIYTSAKSYGRFSQTSK